MDGSLGKMSTEIRIGLAPTSALEIAIMEMSVKAKDHGQLLFFSSRLVILNKGFLFLFVSFRPGQF